MLRVSPRGLPLGSLPVLLLAIGCASAATQAQEGGVDDRPTPRSDPAAVPAQPSAQGGEGEQVDTRPGVAVWAFSNGGSFGSDPWDYSALTVGLQQMLITELSQNPELRLVNRSHIQEIIQELELGQTGYVSPETSARVGQLVQARYMIIGSFVDANGTMRLDARIDNVETGEILAETAAKVQDDRDDLLEMVVELGVLLLEAADLPPLAQEVVAARRATEFSGEGAMLYAQALVQGDSGHPEEAVRLLRRVVDEFPDYDQARQDLEQYESEIR